MIRCACRHGRYRWRIKLYLLDTDLPENDQKYRELTAHVYGATTRPASRRRSFWDRGVRMLRAIGLKPATFHMNEGHSAFLTLELLREQLASGKAVEEAGNSCGTMCLHDTYTRAGGA